MDETGDESGGFKSFKHENIANDGAGDANYSRPQAAKSRRLSSQVNGGPSSDGVRKSGGNRNVKSEFAEEQLSGTIIRPHDAFSMLVNAASKSQLEENAVTGRDAASGLQLQSQAGNGGLSASSSLGNMAMLIDPNLVNEQQTPAYQEAVQTWSRLRFVRAGWFTPEEGIQYVQYFYRYMSPLSPILPPDFSAPERHAQLLNDEPMLTLTILTIASRYMPLKGAGARARAFWMHDKLWEYLQSTITRMFWGQEQFGGGFCGAGNISPEEAEARLRGLRTLGTIESLLLLSDWLPRSMHFPPGNDGDELLAPLDNQSEQLNMSQLQRLHLAWTEPAIRSDRMCWSLVSMAYSLAFELGIFDSLIEHNKWCVGPQPKTLYDSERADRIGRMLFVYVTQACGRLGYPNMMPQQGTEINLDFLKMDVPAGQYS